MIDDILDTKVKIKIARLFAEQKRPLTVSDVSRQAKVSKSRASQCLKELQKHGVLESKAIGRSVVYNMGSGIMARQVDIAFKANETALSIIEKEVVSKTKDLHPVSIALFGSATQGRIRAGSDVDFMLIYEKNIDEKRVYEIVGELTHTLGIHISILPMHTEEFRKKAKRGEEFILNVIASNKLIYGKALEDLVWQQK